MSETWKSMALSGTSPRRSGPTSAGSAHSCAQAQRRRHTRTALTFRWQTTLHSAQGRPRAAQAHRGRRGALHDAMRRRDERQPAATAQLRHAGASALCRRLLLLIVPLLPRRKGIVSLLRRRQWCLLLLLRLLRCHGGCAERLLLLRRQGDQRRLRL